MPTRALSLFVLLVLAPLGVRAQLRGSVRDDDGDPVPAATIRVTMIATGETRAAATDEAGRFLLNLPPGRLALSISSVGFALLTDTIDFQGSTDLDLTLREEALEQPEVVVSASRAARDIEEI